MENPVVKLKPQEMAIQNIDHLGIVAGIIDSIGLVEIINELIGQQEGEKVSPGHVVKAMILNGLGFVSQPLYMFPKYFETIACEHLIGAGLWVYVCWSIHWLNAKLELHLKSLN